jgi:hypothetical protein
VLLEAFRRGWPQVCETVPQRVRREAQAFLRCGDVRYGFVEVSCETCHESRLVAFCCKGRGWCPSCTNRRAVETGVRLAALLPQVRHRQWTLSLPFSLRFVVVKRPVLLKRLERRLVRAVWRWQRQVARRLGVPGPLHGGAVVFTQWFGSSLQLTPHLHALFPEALWTKDGQVVALPAPDDAEVESILRRVLRGARKDFADADAPWPEDEYEALQRESLQRPLGLALPPSPRRRRVAVGMGFSLHADTAVHGHDRQGLERLVRYGARGPVAESRLRRLEDGRYEYTPKKGVAFTLTAAQLVRRLVALVPPPNTHLTSFHGVFAPHAALRPTVTLRPSETTPSPKRKTKPRKPTRRLDWAALHQHTFGTDVLRCPCGGRRRLHAIHSTRQTAEERLLQLGHHLAPRRVLPPATAQPSLPLAG